MFAATRILMSRSAERFSWDLGNTAPVTLSRRWELKLDFRPSPKISGFNLHSLNAARHDTPRDGEHVNEEDRKYGIIRENSVTKDQLLASLKRIEALPEELKQEMRKLWKASCNNKMELYGINVDKDSFSWAASEVKHSRFARKQQPFEAYHQTAVKLSRPFIFGEKDLLKLMEEGGFLRPDVDHDRVELAAYLERRIGKKVYVAFRYDNNIKAYTVDAVKILFSKDDEQMMDHQVAGESLG